MAGVEDVIAQHQVKEDEEKTEQTTEQQNQEEETTQQTESKDQQTEQTEETEQTEQQEETEQTEEQTEESTEQETQKTELDLSQLGDFNSVDEVKTQLNQVKEKDAKIEQLQKEVESLKQTPKFNNDKYYKLDQLEKEDPDNLPAYRMALFNENAPDTEWAKMELAMRYPELADDPEKLERKFKRTYKALYDDSYGEEDEEYVDAKDDMELAAKQAKKKANQKVEEIKTPSAEDMQKEQQEKVQTFAKNWDAPYKEMKQGMEVDLTLPSEKGQSLDVKHTIPDSKVSGYVDMAINQAFQQGLNEPTKENLEQVKDTARKLYIADNLDEFAASIADQVSKKVGVNWREKVHNPKSPKDKTTPAPKEQKKKGDAMSPEEVMQDMGSL